MSVAAWSWCRCYRLKFVGGGSHDVFECCSVFAVVTYFRSRRKSLELKSESKHNKAVSFETPAV